MNILKLLVISQFIVQGASASCRIASPKNYATGKFKVVKVSPAEANCSVTKPEKYIGRSTKAPGCFLELQKVGTKEKYSVYGGDGSCNFKVGQVINDKISNHCCTDIITGCYEKEPPHSNAIWGCTFGAWYIYKPNEGALFPKDFILRQHIFE